MRVIVKIWNGEEDADVIVDMNIELNRNNFGFIKSVIESYIPQPTMKTEPIGRLIHDQEPLENKYKATEKVEELELLCEYPRCEKTATYINIGDTNTCSYHRGYSKVKSSVNDTDTYVSPTLEENIPKDYTPPKLFPTDTSL